MTVRFRDAPFHAVPTRRPTSHKQAHQLSKRCEGSVDTTAREFIDWRACLLCAVCRIGSRLREQQSSAHERTLHSHA